MKLRYCRQFVGVVCLIGVIALTGCRKEKGSAAADTAKTDTVKTEAVKADTAKAEENPLVIAKLVKADLVDGTADNVVRRCASCRLGMDGDAANALTVGKYQMHFCSAGCKDRFAEDPAANILALAIPEGD